MAEDTPKVLVIMSSEELVEYADVVNNRSVKENFRPPERLHQHIISVSYEAPDCEFLKQEFVLELVKLLELGEKDSRNCNAICRYSENRTIVRARTTETKNDL